MPTVSIVVAGLNIHRDDCHREHTNPCAPWSIRRPRLAAFLKARVKASLYLLQEARPDQCRDLSIDLGFGTSRNPAWVVDENNNAILWDRAKWADDEFDADSLSERIGDTGDEHRRSVLVGTFTHISSGGRLRAGSAHFEPGDDVARIMNAKQVVADVPTRGYSADKPLPPVVLSIDRNSWSSAKTAPRAILRAAGFEDLAESGKWSNPTKERSFHGFKTPVRDSTPDKIRDIDGLHSFGLGIRYGRLESTYGTGDDTNRATDHSCIVGGYTLPVLA